MSKYIVISSFPKSGNTYVRAIISRLLFGEDYSAIKDIHREDPRTGQAAMIGKEAFRAFKTHAVSLKAEYQGERLEVGPIIWIRRHPLDVFLSYWHYLKLGPNEIDDVSLRSQHDFAPAAIAAFSRLPLKHELSIFLRAFAAHGTLHPSFRAAGDWFTHCDAWEKYTSDGRGYSVRYEDLVEAPIRTLWPMAKALGYSKPRLEDAIGMAKDDTAIDGKFFWKQQSLNYRSMLLSSDVQFWYEMFTEEMDRFGYSEP